MRGSRPTAAPCMQPLRQPCGPTGVRQLLNQAASFVSPSDRSDPAVYRVGDPSIPDIDLETGARLCNYGGQPGRPGRGARSNKHRGGVVMSLLYPLASGLWSPTAPWPRQLRCSAALHTSRAGAQDARVVAERSVGARCALAQPTAARPARHPGVPDLAGRGLVGRRPGGRGSVRSLGGQGPERCRALVPWALAPGSPANVSATPLRALRLSGAFPCSSPAGVPYGRASG